MKKHIYVYSPSGAVREKAGFRLALSRLRAMGHEVELDADVLRSHLRFAGDDATRVAAIHRAAASGADWAIISRGGYGLTRILDRIDYRRLARAVGKGTNFVGHSDFTALQIALLAKTGASSWAGPALIADFGSATGLDEIMLACFEDVLAGRSHGTGWRLPKARGALAAGQRMQPRSTPSKAASGLLWGGNLSVLTAMLGTPWWPGIAGGILFLEDISEHPYRVERMLTQLLHAGILQRQRAILIGRFSNYELLPHDRGFSLATVLGWIRSQLKVPVYEGLPFGHVPTKVMLPVGQKVDLVVEGREVLLLWGN